MDEVLTKVEAARWRLGLELWLRRALGALAVGLVVAAVAIALPKVVPIDGLPAWWTAAWAGAGVALPLVVASVWTGLRRPGRVEAAIEIDQRFALRERLASSLLLDDQNRDTPAGAALLGDAERAARKIDVGERFGVTLGRRAWLPIAPAIAALALASLVGNRVAQSTPTATPTAKTEADEATKALERARKVLAKRREEADKRNIDDATELLKQVERGTKEVQKLAKLDRAEATVKLNDLAKKLADRRDQLGGADALRKQMNESKDFGRGPAEKAADAMKRGDWKQGAAELAKLQQKVASGDATPDDKKRLAGQLQKMRDKLAEAADKHVAAQRDLKQQLADAQRKGDLAQAAKVQQKLDNLAQQAPAMNQLGQMAEKMAAAQKALEKGDAKQAAQEMAKLGENLDDLAAQAAEMEMLDEAMTNLEACKNGMCENPGEGDAALAQNGGKPGDQGGRPSSNWGYGRGPRDGRDPGDQKDPRYRDSSVKQKVEKGASTFAGLVDGPSIKGDVSEGIKTELNAENVAPADPLTSERLPRSRREHAEEYFRKLRDEL
ncbi:MAG: hypothetical protein ACRCT8_09465 [Lacipirellulaceae bacterium]